MDPRKDLESWEGGLGCSSSSSQTCGQVVLGVLSSVSKGQSDSSGQATEQFLSTHLISEPFCYCGQRQDQIKMAARIRLRFKSAHMGGGTHQVAAEVCEKPPVKFQVLVTPAEDRTCLSVVSATLGHTVCVNIAYKLHPNKPLTVWLGKATTVVTFCPVRWVSQSTMVDIELWVARNAIVC